MKDLKLPVEAEGRFARTIENLLTAEECKAWIASTEKMGYQEALVNVGSGMQVKMTDLRNNKRVIIDSIPVTDIIWERLKPFIPDLFPRTEDEPGYETYNLNERLRFLRYDPGEYFKGHFDGQFFKSATENSPE